LVHVSQLLSTIYAVIGEFPVSDMAVEIADQEMVTASLVEDVTVRPETAAIGATMRS
jgi:hypothetical protein